MYLSGMVYEEIHLHDGLREHFTTMLSRGCFRRNIDLQNIDWTHTRRTTTQQENRYFPEHGTQWLAIRT